MNQKLNKAPTSDELSIWRSKRMAPLQYCSIDRASRLLECEPYDIFHWIETGKIDPVFRVNHFCGRIFIEADLSTSDMYQTYFDYMDTIEFSSELADVQVINPPQVIPSEEGQCIITCNVIVNGFVRIDAPFPEVDDDGAYRVELTEDSLIYLIRGSNWDRSSIGLDIHGDTRLEPLYEDTVLDIQNGLILREDIEKLHHAAVNGTDIGSHVNPKLKRKKERDSHEASGKEHGNSSRFSANRENCIMALLLVKKEFAEECQNKNGAETQEDWASATLNHWVYAGAGYPEPSADLLKKIISDMGRRPEDRTTAGKPKNTATKN
ncbi:hypothetical protein C3F35_17920 [Leclercia sp. LSNIH3]|uniref:hypothetical protein n=1 Tax=Leclercia sp. LSNIH3 TaxID=1920116 RepID=UPI000CDBF3A9|nr:hypothetical protein [Leclercia sp. LSNIH3]AUY40507.1 hypothetical protein C3F35_17920 [Leclercia sp. LSNIH3]POW70142.1 hypothetical protein C3373_15630 [Leclercia sp. LSNIH4]